MPPENLIVGFFKIVLPACCLLIATVVFFMFGITNRQEDKSFFSKAHILLSIIMSSCLVLLYIFIPFNEFIIGLIGGSVVVILSFLICGFVIWIEKLNDS